MLNGLFILVFYQLFFLPGRKLYKNKIEKKYEYKIPAKIFQGSVDRNLVYYDDDDDAINKPV